MKKQAVLSLSGGMDSSSLLLHLLANGYEVTALSFDYGQKHHVELERAQSLVEYINSEWTKQHPPFDNDKTTSFYPVTHQIIKLDGLQELLNSALVTGGKDVPEGHYEQDNMKETVVPNRNKIFSSLIQAVALSLATTGEKHPVDIALGIHAGDFVVYLDCRAEFRDADLHAFRVGNWDSELVNYYTPYLNGTKLDILKDGERCCKHLGLSFDEVYSRTNTSYKPIFIQDEKVPFVMPTYNTIKKKGNWYSDYKSAASVERIEAFIKLGRPDPVAYADLENGPVSWEVARDHVLKVLENNSGGSRS
jgi:7-cyano-7-deazaguanine synthase